MSGLPQTATMAAILIAASSNDLLKAVYAGAFAGWRDTAVPVAALVALAAAGLAAAVWLTHGLV